MAGPSDRRVDLGFLFRRNPSRKALSLCGASALACAIAVGALLQAGDGLAQQRPSVRLAEVRNQDAPAVIPGQYIVVFGQGEAAGAVATAVSNRVAATQSQAAEALVRRLGGTVTFRYRSALVGFSARLSPAALAAVRAMPGVAWIEADQRVTLDTLQYPAPTGLDRTSERVGIGNGYTYSTDGQGVHVYVIDTGIAPHPDYGSRLDTSPAAEFTAITNDNFGASDCNGHGTHVAGTIGGTHHGIAKNVTLHRVRVLSCGGGGSWAGVIAGVDWVTNQKAAHPLQPSVANMSLAGGGSSAVDAAVNNSITQGVTYVVAAANNGGQPACNYSPARVPAAITVGAINPVNDSLASFSNLGSCVDLFAPGVNITSTWIGPPTNILSGTSMASPHVAGVAALVLGLNPATTPANVWSAIDYAASVPGTHASYTWNGIGGLPSGSPNKLLHWGSVPSDGFMDGDPHLTTVDGTRYDFQGAGEYVYLREPGGMEIQVRHTPVQTASRPGFADPYTGLSTCVSVNSAVAARVGPHRVTLQPNLSGTPDPSGLQLRVDGALQTLTPQGINLGGGVVRLTGGNGMEIRFADGARLVAVPGWWPAQQLWYLNVDIFQTTARSGLMGAKAPGSWLPGLPNGTSVGVMPGALNQRYAVLYGQFGEAWRVSSQTSLFDYRRGTSTANFTNRSWPTQSGSCLIPRSPAPPAVPLDRRQAEQACSALPNRQRRADCIFDVAVTGERRFARTYLVSEEIRRGLEDDVHLDDPPPQPRD